MNIELKLPADLDAIKLKDYQKYISIMEKNPDASEEFTEIKTLEIFCGVSYKEIQSVPFGAFSDVTHYMSELFKSKPNFTRRFEIQGSDGAVVEFGFIPNLDKISMGEYIDLNNYFADVNTMHKAMAVLFRPIHPSYSDKESYRIDSYKGTEKYSELMKEMPLGIAIAAKVFFYRLGMKLSKVILSYSHEAVESQEIQSEEEKQLLMKNISGIKSFMLSQEEMLSKSMMLP